MIYDDWSAVTASLQQEQRAEVPMAGNPNVPRIPPNLWSKLNSVLILPFFNIAQSMLMTSAKYLEYIEASKMPLIASFRAVHITPAHIRAVM